MIPGIVAGHQVAGGGGTGDPLWANVAFYLRFNEADGATSFTDEKGNTWTGFGGVQTDDQNQLFGNNLQMDGTDDYLECDSNWAVESTDFTLDIGYRPASVSGNRTLFYNGNPNDSGNAGVLLRATNGGGLLFGMLGGTNITAASVLTNDAWNRIRVCRDATSTRIYVGGSQVASGSQGNGANSASFKARLGRYRNGASNYPVCRLDECRLTMGVARTTGSSYVVETSEFPTGGG